MSDNDGDDLENKVDNLEENISISNNAEDNGSISSITIDMSGNIEEYNEEKRRKKIMQIMEKMRKKIMQIRKRRRRGRK